MPSPQIHRHVRVLTNELLITIFDDCRDQSNLEATHAAQLWPVVVKVFTASLCHAGHLGLIVYKCRCKFYTETQYPLLLLIHAMWHLCGNLMVAFSLQCALCPSKGLKCIQ